MKNNHKGKRLFITGIPTSGKTYLAKKISNEIDAIVVHLDNLRADLSKDSKYKTFTNFYLDKNEEEYLTKTSPEQIWNDLVWQSENLWPAFEKEINRYKDEEKPVVFECVNLLPHIAQKYLDFDGVVLIGDSYRNTLERNKKEPRWGATEDLQKLEAESFFNVERPRYKAEAEKNGYPVFETADEAFEYCLNLLQ